MLKVNGKVTKIEKRSWESDKTKDENGDPVTGTEYTVTLTYAETGQYDRFVLGRNIDGEAFERECSGVYITGPVRFSQRYDEANRRMFSKLILLAYDVVRPQALLAEVA